MALSSGTETVRLTWVILKCAWTCYDLALTVYLSATVLERRQVSVLCWIKSVEHARSLIASQDVECFKLVSRAICHYYFPLCGNLTNILPPSSLCKEECARVQSTCPSAWKAAATAFSDTYPFINCEATSQLLNPLPICCSGAGLKIVTGKWSQLCRVYPMINLFAGVSSSSREALPTSILLSQSQKTSRATVTGAVTGLVLLIAAVAVAAVSIIYVYIRKRRKRRLGQLQHNNPMWVRPLRWLRYTDAIARA